MAFMTPSRPKPKPTPPRPTLTPTLPRPIPTLFGPTPTQSLAWRPLQSMLLVFFCYSLKIRGQKKPGQILKQQVLSFGVSSKSQSKSQGKTPTEQDSALGRGQEW